MRRVVRGLSAVALLIGVLATHPVRLSGACSVGVVTSPQGNFDAREPSTSGDGRYTVFYTQSSLIPADTNNHVDVYVVDRLTCALEVVSVATNGDQGNNPSTYATISADGQMVAFMSTASNLVANDTNVGVDVFVRNRAAGTTIRASVKSNGTQAVAGSDRPRISSDGQVVAFRSNANDLVPGNVTGVFVRDLAAGTTELISAGGDVPAISADGRYVVFASIVSTLVPGDTNNASDVFRYDRQTATTIRVSVQTGGAEGPTGTSNFPSISGDGRFIAFDYLGGPPLIAGGQAVGIYVHDVDTVTTELISVPLTSGAVVVGTRPSISADGRYVAFAGGMGIAVGDTTSLLDVMVRDRLTGETRRVSAAADGTEGNLSAPSLGIPDISDDGTVVAYASNSNNLVPNDTNGRDDVFIAEWRLVSMTPNVNLMRNGGFTTGTTTWQPFATPDLTYIDLNVTSGVLQFNRVAPPPNTSNQAVVLQRTTAQLRAGSPLVATFQLGNSSTVRKRISVLLHDEDFSDLAVCTFWLPPATALQTYTMRTHTTEAWSGATISFYAATEGADGGYNRLDNVTLQYAPAGADDETDCVDPLAPVPSGIDGPDLIVNGSFGGSLPPWNAVHDLVWQLSNGVFEFFRPGTPNTLAGVVLQQTGATATSGEILTAQFDLGNSSSVRKRVTVLLHDIDFSDLSACTFWIPAGQPPATYAMRSYATEAWTDATISVYAATVGAETWTQLDNVSLRRTPGSATDGTNCSEPGSAPLPGADPAVASTANATAPAGLGFTRLSEVLPGGGPGWIVAADTTAPYSVTMATPMDLRQTASPRLRFESRLVAHESTARVQVSTDGRTWHDLAAVPSSQEWTQVNVDLSAFAGHVLYVRFVFDAVAPATGHAAETWQLMNVTVDHLAAGIIAPKETRDGVR